MQPLPKIKTRQGRTRSHENPKIRIVQTCAAKLEKIGSNPKKLRNSRPKCGKKAKKPLAHCARKAEDQ